MILSPTSRLRRPPPRVTPRAGSRFARLSARLLPALLATLLAACTSPPPTAAGIVWQPDGLTTRPRGNWQQIGVHKMLVQWAMVDNYGIVDGCGATPLTPAPDWARIAAEPWAGDIILGLGARFIERDARAQMPALLAQSNCIAALALPFKVSGWYFPVEIDPTWTDAATLAPILNRLPRPLWVSVYDNSNIGGPALADWLAGWLPADVGVFFQDGVGLHVRSAPVAAGYMRALQQRLGSPRVRVIAEAFRPMPGGTFRAASAAELGPQLQAYAGYQTYLFEGPRYVPQQTLDGLR
jgi:hypothetical protein